MRRKNKPKQNPEVAGNCARLAHAPRWITAELIAMTRKVWQPYYKTPLTTDELVTILVGVGRLFKVFAGKQGT